jgi:hypothetical protein
MAESTYRPRPPPPTHTHTSEVYFNSGGGGISRAVPLKCSPLAQIRREQKSLALFYLFTLWHATSPYYNLLPHVRPHSSHEGLFFPSILPECIKGYIIRAIFTRFILKILGGENLGFISREKVCDCFEFVATLRDVTCNNTGRTADS